MCLKNVMITILRTIEITLSISPVHVMTHFKGDTP